MQAVVDALVALAAWIWNAFNTFMVWLVDGMLAIWPSTPAALKVSTHVASLQAALPGAPWWLLGDLAWSVPAILGPVIVFKIVDLVWP